MMKVCRDNAAVRTAFVKLQHLKNDTIYEQWEAGLSIHPKTNQIESTGKNLKTDTAERPETQSGTLQPLHQEGRNELSRFQERTR